MSPVNRTEIVLANGRAFGVLLGEGGFYLETGLNDELEMLTFLTPDEARVLAALLIAASAAVMLAGQP
jgi:hypothetical protein